MKRILGVISLLAVVLLGAVLVYSWWGRSMTAEQYVDGGKKYYEQGKYPEATIQFLNALAKDAQHREARLLLARSYMNQGIGPAAVSQLTTLLEQYPGDIAATLQMGNLYLAAGGQNPDMLRQAQDMAWEVMSKEPDNIDALLLSGNALAGRLEYASAEEQFRKVLRIDPRNLTAYVNTGNLLIQQNRPDEAEKILLEAKAIDSKHRYVLVSLVTVYTLQKKTDKADAILQELLEHYSNDRGVYSEVVRTYVGMGRPEVGERILKSAQEKSPADPAPSLELVDLYFSTNRASEAHRFLWDLKSKYSGSSAVAKKVARVFMQLEPDRSKREIQQILQADDRDPEGYLLRGTLELQEQRLDAAKTSFEQALALNGPRAEIHLFLGRIAATQGDLQKAESEFNEAVRANPSSTQPQLALAQLSMSQARWADARLQLDKVLELQPANFEAKRLLAGVDVAEGKLEAAERQLLNLVRQQPLLAAIQYQLGTLYQRKGALDKAETYLQRALELEPESELNARTLVEFYLRQRQADKAVQALDARVPDANKTGFHYELIGQAYVNASKFPDAETALRKALELEPGRSSAYTAIADVYLKMGTLEKIPRQMDAQLKLNPRMAFSHVMKAFAFQLQGRSRDAMQGYLTALDIEPNNVFAANNLAYLLAEQNYDLPTAAKWAQTARRLAPSNGEVADTLGWVLYKQGYYMLARDQFLFALSKLPDSEIIWYHLGLAHMKANAPNEAEAALKRALGTNRNFEGKGLAQAALTQLQYRQR